MSQRDGLELIGLVLVIGIYVLFSTLDLPTLLGSEQRLPPTLELVHESLAAAFWRGVASRTRVLTEFLAVLLVTQLIPVVLISQAETPSAVRTASVIELVLALGWTVLLVLVGSRRIKG